MPNPRTDGYTPAAIASPTFTGTVTLPSTTYTADWADYGATSTVVGFSGTPTKNIYTKKIGNTVFVQFLLDGTSNSTATSFTLPYTISNTVDIHACGRGIDNGAGLTTPILIYGAKNGTTIGLYKDMAAAAWTNSGVKDCWGQFWYEATT